MHNVDCFRFIDMVYDYAYGPMLRLALTYIYLLLFIHLHQQSISSFHSAQMNYIKLNMELVINHTDATASGIRFQLFCSDNKYLSQRFGLRAH